MMERPCEACRSTQFSPLFDRYEHHFTRCRECGLERIDPQPTDATLGQIYGKHYYDAWGLEKDGDTVAQLKKRTFGHLLDQLPPPRPGDKLLDLGAATGFLMELAEERGFKAYGVELSDFGAGEIARKLGAERVHGGQLEAAKFRDAKPGDFAVVTMCDYIEHVRDPRTVLEQAKSWLAPGGVVAITTPDTGSLSRRVLSSGWSHYKVEHLYYFCRHNLKTLLEGAGFARVEFRPLWKALSLKYIREQFEVYPHPVLSRVARLAGRVVPDTLQERPLRMLTGELVALAYRS